MPKVKPFGIGDVDDLVDAKNEFNSEVLPKGVYQFKVKRMTQGTIRKEGENKGKTRFAILLECVGPKKTPSKYIGAGVWTSINVIKSGAGMCNDFINALAGPDEKAQRALRRKFWTPDIFVDKDGNVLKIGTKKIGSPDGEIVVTARTKMGPDNSGGQRTEIQTFLIPKGVSDDEDDDEDDEDFEDEDLDDDDDEVDDDEDDEDEDEEEDEDDEEDDEEDDDEEDDEDEDEEDDPQAVRESELNDLTLAKLRPIAKTLEIDTKGLDKVALISSILEEEFPEDEDDEDDENELRTELDRLSEIALRKRIKATGAKLADYKGKSKEDLIDMIVEAELGEEDDEEEPF